jgi:hypothetical protein
MSALPKVSNLTNFLCAVRGGSAASMCGLAYRRGVGPRVLACHSRTLDIRSRAGAKKTPQGVYPAGLRSLAKCDQFTSQFINTVFIH